MGGQAKTPEAAADAFKRLTAAKQLELGLTLPSSRKQESPGCRCRLHGRGTLRPQRTQEFRAVSGSFL